MPKNQKFKYIDLFAGVGGMREGFDTHGCQCVLTCEINDDAILTYKENYHPNHAHLYFKDVFDLTAKNIPPYNILIAGFPCQPFSIAGLRKGLKDKRGEVFSAITRILKETKPDAFLLENVKGIVNHDKGETFKYMLKELEIAGYHIKQPQVLNSMTHANVPQNRERVFIVGMKSKKNITKFEYPKPLRLKKTIHDCLDLKGETVKQNHIYDDRYECFTVIKESVTKSDTLYQWRRQYVRENKSKACPTLTANMGSGGHNVPLVLDPKTKKIRKLTPRETANFQGFRKDFILPKIADSKLYHQFGNSVTVPLIERIAEKMIIALTK